MHTADPRYLWVNTLPVWGQGRVDLARREIRISGFVASDLPLA